MAVCGSRQSNTHAACVCCLCVQAINKLAEALEMLQLMPPQQQQLGQAQPEQQQPLDLGQQQQQQQPEQQQRWAIDVGACPGLWQGPRQRAPGPTCPAMPCPVLFCPWRSALVTCCPTGGWTSYLADTAGFNVIAIDPSQLHADVVARPNVHYIKQLAADALGRVDELLALHGGQVCAVGVLRACGCWLQQPAAARTSLLMSPPPCCPPTTHAQADLLVCDANDHAVCVRTFLAPLLPKLKSGGWLIVTCKFYGRGYKADIAATMAKLLPVRCCCEAVG
jgi:SAM-dependent methyltransferase